MRILAILSLALFLTGTLVSPSIGKDQPCKVFMNCSCPCEGSCNTRLHGSDDHIDVQCARCNKQAAKEKKIGSNWQAFWWCPKANSFVQ